MKTLFTMAYIYMTEKLILKVNLAKLFQQVKMLDSWLGIKLIIANPKKYSTLDSLYILKIKNRKTPLLLFINL